MSDPLEVQLAAERRRCASLEQQLRESKMNAVQLAQAAEQEEEYVTNKLLARLSALSAEKATLLRQVEAEEEMISNTLQRKLDQVRGEAQALQSRLDNQEERAVTADAAARCDALQAEKAALQQRVSALEADAAAKQLLEVKVACLAQELARVEAEYAKLRDEHALLKKQNITLENDKFLSEQRAMRTKEQLQRVSDNLASVELHKEFDDERLFHEVCSPREFKSSQDSLRSRSYRSASIGSTSSGQLGRAGGSVSSDSVASGKSRENLCRARAGSDRSDPSPPVSNPGSRLSPHNVPHLGLRDIASSPGTLLVHSPGSTPGSSSPHLIHSSLNSPRALSSARPVVKKPEGKPLKSGWVNLRSTEAAGGAVRRVWVGVYSNESLYVWADEGLQMALDFEPIQPPEFAVMLDTIVVVESVIEAKSREPCVRLVSRHETMLLGVESSAVQAEWFTLLDELCQCGTVTPSSSGSSGSLNAAALSRTSSGAMSRSHGLTSSPLPFVSHSPSSSLGHLGPAVAPAPGSTSSNTSSSSPHSVHITHVSHPHGHMSSSSSGSSSSARKHT